MNQLLASIITISLLLSVNCMQCAGATTTVTAQSTRSPAPKSPVTPSDFIIQSHRGAGELLPENTLPAFELGWELKTWPEADIRTTSDGVLIAFHDTTLNRVVTNLPAHLDGKNISELGWREIEDLDVGSYMDPEHSRMRICTVSQIFERMTGKPQRHLYLDVKEADLSSLAALVNEQGVAKQVVLSSPRQEDLIAWKKLVPGSDTLLWISGKTEQVQREKFEAAKNRGFEGLTQVQIHTHLTTSAEFIRRDTTNPFTASDTFLMEAGKISREHGLLYQTLPYGGSSAEIFWKLLDLGFMSFSTDHPKVTLKAVQDYYPGAKFAP